LEEENVDHFEDILILMILRQSFAEDGTEKN
jgi:hypothetical protein